jgi:hypothetical protein
MNETQDKSLYSNESYRFLSGFLDLIFSTTPPKAVGPRRREPGDLQGGGKTGFPFSKKAETGVGELIAEVSYLMVS